MYCGLQILAMFREAIFRSDAFSDITCVPEIHFDTTWEQAYSDISVIRYRFAKASVVGLASTDSYTRQ